MMRTVSCVGIAALVAACGPAEEWEEFAEVEQAGHGTRNGLDDDAVWGLLASSALRNGPGHSTLKPIAGGFNAGIATLADNAGDDWWEWSMDAYKRWKRQDLLRYIAKCALPPGHALRVPYPGGGFINYWGETGMMPLGWFQGSALSYTDRRWLSACLLAHLNANASSMDIALVANHPAIGTALYPGYSVQEAAFYGDMFSAGAPDELGCGGYVRGANGLANGWYSLNLHARACDSVEADTDGTPCDGITPDTHADPNAICSTACTPIGWVNGHPQYYGNCGPHGVNEVITVYLPGGAATSIVRDPAFDDCFDGVRYRRCAYGIQ